MLGVRSGLGPSKIGFQREKGTLKNILPKTLPGGGQVASKRGQRGVRASMELSEAFKRPLRGFKRVQEVPKRPLGGAKSVHGASRGL